ncbi:unnamed protein product [Bursaphelenchus okinawaensis]|uniref:Tubulin-specific chaperone E n=1 Tax=Bursaphelenchus okinawaensis TaxID=465554 RepID=A0A811KYJ9_9BILA|nr:unnamed protein product [Bursaphelenchus okinawaensis]CAG9113949.1 unnamed protein product [Bursaphelenchus okinawaensis]
MTVQKLPNVGDRVGVGRKRGFIRFVGNLHINVGSGEIWLGIEWDNDGDGKHDGILQGKRYFQTRKPRSGSFVRLKDAILGKGFIETLKDQYSGQDEQLEEIIFVIKQKEFDFSYVEKRSILVLESKYVAHLEKNVNQKFDRCLELSLANNLLSTFKDVFDILSLFPSITVVDLSFNKMKLMDEMTKTLKYVTSLNLSSCLLDVETISKLQCFPNLKNLYLMNNELEYVPDLSGYEKLELVDLSANPLVDFTKLWKLKDLKRLSTLNLKKCGFTSVQFDEKLGFDALECLWLDSNPFGDWESINQLARLPSLKNIRTGDLYVANRNLQTYEIFVAKLPKIKILNGCTITETERTNCEKFFQVRFSEPPILKVHEQDLARFEAKYGAVYEKPPEEETNIKQIKMKLKYGDKVINRTILLSVNMENIVAMASRLLRFDPSRVEVKVEIQKGVFDTVEWNSSRVLRAFEPEEGAMIEFVDE